MTLWLGRATWCAYVVVATHQLAWSSAWCQAALPAGCAAASAGARVALCVTNPPWGGRLQGAGAPAVEGGDDARASAPDERDVSGLEIAPGDLPDTWFALGQFLKQRCGGAQAAVLCGNRDVAAKLFLPLNRRHPLTVGGVDCRLLHFTLLPPKLKAAGSADAAAQANQAAGSAA